MMRVITTQYRIRIDDAQRNARQRPVYVLSTHQRVAPGRRLLSREAVPGFTHGVKVARVRWVGLALSAKLHDVHVDGARHYVRRISPDLAQQLRARDDLTRPRDQ